MNNQTNDVVEKQSKKNRSIIFVLYIALLFLLFFVLTSSGIEPFLTSLILLFLLLVMIGPIFYGFRSPYYSQLFRKKTTKWTERKPSNTKSKIPKPYTTEIKFRKPLIRKCPSCGMTIANFVKKCPQCGTVIMG